MANGNDNNEFPAKYLKKLNPEFVDAINGMSDEEVKQRILACEGNLYEIASAKSSDEKLAAAREVSKDLSKPYSESKAIETSKLNYCLFVLEGRGINLN